MPTRAPGHATRALEARHLERGPVQVSGVPTQRLYTLMEAAVAFEGETRRLVGVAAQGMLGVPGS